MHSPQRRSAFQSFSSHSSNIGEFMRTDSARRSRARIAKAPNTNNHGTKPRAKRNGKGPIASINPTRIRALKSRGLSADKIATKLKISKSSVYQHARA
jgi:DNA invertase Pin-like site-specific DNA recombinase